MPNSERPITGTEASPQSRYLTVELNSQAIGTRLRQLSLAVIALGVAASSLTFNWVIEHDAQENFFPEFAGRVVYLSDILVFLGVGLWATGWYLCGREQIIKGPRYVFLPIIALTALSVISVVWAVDGGHAGYSALRRVLLLGMYIALVNEASRARAPMIAALIGIGLLHAWVAIAQVANGSALGVSFLGELTPGAFTYERIGSPRAYGLGFNPNPVGVWLAATSVLAYGLFLTWRGARHWRTFWLLSFGATFLGLAATGSRSAAIGWVFAIVAVTVAARFRKPDIERVSFNRPATAALFVVLIGGVFLIAAAVGENSQGLGPVRFTPASIGSGYELRAQDLKLSFPVIRDNLALGVGSGNLPMTLKNRLRPDAISPIFTPTHNVLLLLQSELGIAGAAAWLLIMVAPAIWAFSLLRAGNPANDAALLWLGPVLIVLFESLLDFTPWATQDGRVLLIAVLAMWAGKAATFRASSKAVD
jgi:hypothetical protein